MHVNCDCASFWLSPRVYTFSSCVKWLKGELSLLAIFLILSVWYHILFYISTGTTLSVLLSPPTCCICTSTLKNVDELQNKKSGFFKSIRFKKDNIRHLSNTILVNSTRYIQLWRYDDYVITKLISVRFSFFLFILKEILNCGEEKWSAFFRLSTFLEGGIDWIKYSGLYKVQEGQHHWFVEYQKIERHNDDTISLDFLFFVNISFLWGFLIRVQIPLFHFWRIYERFETMKNKR